VCDSVDAGDAAQVWFLVMSCVWDDDAIFCYQWVPGGCESEWANGRPLLCCERVFAACRSLTAEGKKLLTQYGSSLINNLRFRDNFVMIGQKGLAEGSAVEQVFTYFLLLVQIFVCLFWLWFSHWMYWY